MTTARAFKTVRDLADAKRRRENHRLVFVAVVFFLAGLFMGVVI